jgi:hypothetical protein
MKTWEAVFLGIARLHRQHPEQRGFRGNEILEAVQQLAPEQRVATVNAHIYLHCVANVKPNPAIHRVSYRNPDGTFRLYREGDDCHPARRDGRSAPEAAAVPEQYHELLHWYHSEYAAPRSGPGREDPILGLRGVGRDVWRSLGGVNFIDSLRNETPQSGDFGAVWDRIRQCAGDGFYTSKGFPFTYELLDREGPVWVRRGGRLINRALSRSQFERAWARTPLESTSQVHDLQGPSYLFAILTDPRIRG